MNFLKYKIFALVIILSASSCDETEQTPSDDISTPDGYSLIWQDEFNNSELDLSSWAYETGDGTAYGLPAGWGNDELQIYTSNAENSQITSGTEVSSLEITAIEDGSGGYTSAKLVTKNLLSVRFGRIDA